MDHQNTMSRESFTEHLDVALVANGSMVAW